MRTNLYIIYVFVVQRITPLCYNNNMGFAHNPTCYGKINSSRPRFYEHALFLRVPYQVNSTRPVSNLPGKVLVSQPILIVKELICPLSLPAVPSGAAQ